MRKDGNPGTDSQIGEVGREKREILDFSGVRDILAA
jgi:hypothetical protein